MRIDGLQTFRLSDRDMIEADPHYRTVLSMRPINPRELLAITSAQSHPDVAKLRDHWSGNVSNVFVGREVWENVVQN